MGMIGNSLAQGLISGANIVDGTVDTPDIKDSAVTAAKIATGVVTPGKLSTGAPTWDTSGNIGINTATPNRPVHLGGPGARNYFKAETTTNSVSNEAGFEVKTPSANFFIGAWGNTNALWIYDATAGLERARFDANGRFGIATSAPWRPLTIYGGLGTGDQFITVTSTIGSATKVGIELNPSMTVSDATNNPAQAAIYAIDSNYSANIIFANKAAGALGNALTERARIDSGGRVGIGASANLSARLTVNGGIDTGANWGSSGSTLHIDNDSSSANGSQIRVSYWGGGPYGPLKFNVGGSERARIDASGNLTVNGYHVMRQRGGVAWADVNSFVGSSYDGYWTIAFSGHSGWLFSQNSGGSSGTIQMYSTYFDGPWYRSNTDNASWTSWRQL